MELETKDRKSITEMLEKAEKAIQGLEAKQTGVLDDYAKLQRELL